MSITKFKNISFTSLKPGDILLFGDPISKFRALDGIILTIDHKHDKFVYLCARTGEACHIHAKSFNKNSISVLC